MMFSFRKNKSHSESIHLLNPTPTYVSAFYRRSIFLSMGDVGHSYDLGSQVNILPGLFYEN